MRCRKVTHQISAFLDGELTPKEAARIQKHLDACPRCRAEREALERTIHSVKELPLVPAPASLRDNVLAGLEGEAEEKAPVPAPARSRRAARSGFSPAETDPIRPLLGAGIA